LLQGARRVCRRKTRNLPFAAFEHNRVWLELSLIAQELLAWTRLPCLDGELALAEPKRLRQRLLHVAGKGRALGPAHDPAPAALLALGRSLGRGLRPAALTPRRGASIDALAR